PPRVPTRRSSDLQGISRLPDGRTVQIALEAGADSLRLTVRNPSLPPEAPGVQGAGHAQRSIAHRLGYAFGPRARMACGWDAGYYACELQLPLAPGRRTP